MSADPATDADAFRALEKVARECRTRASGLVGISRNDLQSKVGAFGVGVAADLYIAFLAFALPSELAGSHELNTRGMLRFARLVARVTAAIDTDSGGYRLQ